MSNLEIGIKSDSRGLSAGKLSESLLAAYKLHIEKWPSSGLSQSKYCELHGLNANRFCYIRGLQLKAKSQGVVTSSFVPVRTSPVPSRLVTLDLHFRGGSVLKVPMDMSESQLRALFASLGERL